jgi:hypothetical protein
MPTPRTEFLQERLQFCTQGSPIKPEGIAEPNFSGAVKFLLGSLNKLLTRTLHLGIEITHIQSFAGKFQNTPLSAT